MANLTEIVAGYLEIGVNEKQEIIINVDYSNIEVDENNVGHIIFSISQAYNLVVILLRKIEEARKQKKKERRKKMEIGN